MTVAQKIINELSGRGGFDGWWDGIDNDIQRDIIWTIDEIIDAGREQESADLMLLEALRQTGVDNWGGYGDAQTLLDEWRDVGLVP